MLTVCLGLAWLSLGPFALWLLVRGRVAARTGAVVVLALLEAATVVLPAEREPGEVAARESAPGPEAACVERDPSPERATLSERGAALTLSWQAVPGECPTAEVVVRHDGRRLRVWLHESPADAARGGTRVLPVRVDGDEASLRLPLGSRPGRGGYVAVDGRTGHRIPGPQPAGPGRDAAPRT
ncbi:hypothetical protein ACGF0J_31435 [Nonomuraea sp. NPDC047897]|uniref:hypothetical protein n=1 Tax=Nonomuraea sp. NPDC047897 TaxID=3364346 RepID=UPI00371E4314